MSCCPTMIIVIVTFVGSHISYKHLVIAVLLVCMCGFEVICGRHWEYHESNMKHCNMSFRVFCLWMWSWLELEVSKHKKQFMFTFPMLSAQEYQWVSCWNLECAQLTLHHSSDCSIHMGFIQIEKKYVLHMYLPGHNKV